MSKKPAEVSKVLPESGISLFEATALQKYDSTTPFKSGHADTEGNLMESVRVTGNNGIASPPQYLTVNQVPERKSINLNPTASSNPVISDISSPSKISANPMPQLDSLRCCAYPFDSVSFFTRFWPLPCIKDWKTLELNDLHPTIGSF